MKVFKITFIFILIGVAQFSTAFCANVLVWDNDCDKWIFSTERTQYEGCEQGIRRALIANGHTVTCLKNLPTDLDSYDVIFVVLGYADCAT